jgi:pyrroloquinoline quinone biosynthesis protein B
MAEPAARLTAIVLGAAAGGGYPQWNCRCPVCRLAWEGDPRVSPRTQASLAVSGDGAHWILLNAAPDLRAQIAATAELRPARDARGSPIAGVVLTGGEIDQIAGLLNLRERQPFDIFATAETIETLDANAMFEVLARDVVTRRAIALDTPFALPGGLEAELFAVPGKVPLYMETGDDDLGSAPGGNVGVEVRAGGARLAFVPGAAMIPPELAQRLARADVVLFDGTLFADDEMIRHGLGGKTGQRMGHMSIDGDGGSLAALSQLPGRRVYIHLNNTNPVLVEGSPERRKVAAAGWEVAADGLKIAL